MAANAPAAGSAYKSSDPPKRRATVRMIGRNTTRPASKKMGKPKNRLATPSASGARWAPKREISVSASTWAPPVTSSSRPSIAPKPTSSATAARVSPNQNSSTEGTSPSGICVASAVSRLTSTSARKACSLTCMMSTSSRATAAAAMSSRTPVP